MDASLVARLMLHVAMEPNTGCWIWTGADDGGDGYGRVVVNGKQRAVHRVAYEELVGDIPEGLVLDHKCRVRCCINPDHLEPVTSGENTRRGFAGSKPKTHCLRGHSFEEHGYISASGQRKCSACNTIRSRLSYDRIKNPRKDQVK